MSVIASTVSKSEINTILEIMAEAFTIPLSDINQDWTYQSTLEWDSMGHINLILALEKHFKVKISPEEMLELSSVNKIVQYFFANTRQSKEVYVSRKIYRGLRDVFIDNTKIALIDGEKGQLFYRGYNIAELVNKASYEEVIYLLLNAKVPNQAELQGFKAELAQLRELPAGIISLVKLLVANEKSAEAILQASISALSSSFSKLPAKEQVLAYIVQAPLILGYHRSFLESEKLPKIADTLSHAEYSVLMLTGSIPAPEIVRIYEQKMIIQAEHSLNASAFSARVATSTGSDVGSAFTAAIATFCGPLHGGALFSAMEMLEEIGSTERVKDYLKTRIQNHLPIYGFGHRVYKTEDPRAQPLKLAAEYMSQQAKESHWFELLEAVKAEMTDYMAHGMNVNVDFYAGVSFKLMGFSNDLLVPIFVLNRLAGWGAHILEQQENNILIRPRLQYVGEVNKQFMHGAGGVSKRTMSENI